MNLQPLLDWLTALPPAMLLAAMALLAAAENIFPPIPADVLIAFGAFLAARGNSSPWPPLLAVLIGNIAGAMGMYIVGRRFGAVWTGRRFHIHASENADATLSAWYARFGIVALFLVRFIPGARAVVAPFAGAFRLPVGRTALAIAGASVVWYGLITLVAYRAGSNWDGLVHLIARLARNTALVAIVLVVVLAALWLRHRRRRRAGL